MYEATTILKLSNAILNSFIRIENRTEPTVTKTKMLYYVSSTEKFTTGHSREEKLMFHVIFNGIGKLPLYASCRDWNDLVTAL
jgi:hypothetical protein